MSGSDKILARKKDSELIRRYAHSGLFQFLWSLKIIKEKEYYLDYGYGSMEEFCRDEFDLARPTMYRYLQVANKFLPEKLAKPSVQNLENEPNSQEVSQMRQNELGLFKLEILAAGLSSRDCSQFVETGEVEINNETYTLEDFKLMPGKDIKKLLDVNDKEEQEHKDFSFPKVHDKTEKLLQKLVNLYYACPDIPDEKREALDKSIEEIVEVFNSVKKLFEI